MASQREPCSISAACLSAKCYITAAAAAPSGSFSQPSLLIPLHSTHICLRSASSQPISHSFMVQQLSISHITARQTQTPWAAEDLTIWPHLLLFRDPLTPCSPSGSAWTQHHHHLWLALKLCTRVWKVQNLVIQEPSQLFYSRAKLTTNFKHLVLF